MLKNIAGQHVGAQMLTAADGSAFTGAVTVYVTVNNGTQAIGSVGSGVCTHEGNGYHSYEPSQAETNGDQLAFTFIGTGAAPVTVQAYTGVDVVAINGSAASASKLQLSTSTMANGTTVTGTLTTTIFTTDLDTDYTVDDALNGHVIIFLGDISLALNPQAGVISSYSAATGEITIASPLTVAPVNGDSFVIV